MRLREIIQILEAKRETHPELRRLPIDWRCFRAILDREEIEIVVAPCPRPAQLVPYQGGWTIILSSNFPTRRHLYAGAHELGHLWLHHDSTCARTERCYNMDVEWEADPREDDAEAFAGILLGETAVRAYASADLDQLLMSQIAGVRSLRELDLLGGRAEQFIASGTPREEIDFLLKQRRQEIKEHAMQLLRDWRRERNSERTQ